jgi:hypothetical protein
MKKEILIGVVVGILATLFGFYAYVEFVLSGSFQDSLTVIHKKNLYGQILSIAAIPNLLVFFVFIKKKQDYKARGVLIATFLVAFLILISQFF